MRTLSYGLLIVAVTVACGKGDNSETAAGSSASGSSASSAVTGTWTGTWKRTQPVSGGGELALQMGTAPTFKRVGTACPPAETPATVTVEGDRITIVVDTPEVQAKYTGVRNGREMSGELTTTCRAGTGAGTWTMTAK